MRFGGRTLVKGTLRLSWGTHAQVVRPPMKSLVHACVRAAAAAKSLQSCPTLCDPIDGSPPGSTVPGILQVRTLEWVAISFSNAWKWKVKVKSLSRVWLLATPWTAAYQAPMPMGFSRQEYWSGVPWPSPAYVSRYVLMTCRGFCGSIGKESACNVWDPDSIPKSGRSPGEVNGNLLHHACLGNPMNRGAWQAEVLGSQRVGQVIATEPQQSFRLHRRDHGWG